MQNVCERRLWKREIQEILPGAYVEIVERIADVARFVRTVQMLPAERMAFAVCSKEMAKLGSGHEPAFVQKFRLETVETTFHDTNAPLASKWLESQLSKWLESDGHREIENIAEIDDDGLDDLDVQLDPAFLETAYLGHGDGYPSNPIQSLQALNTTPTLKDSYIILRERTCCPHCGVEIRDSEDRLVGPEYFENKKRFCQECASPLFQMIHLNQRGKREVQVARLKTIRYPIAEYIRRNHPGFFGLFIGDEVHEAKGHSTDVGYALSSLAQACRHTLGMTGTIFGGYSSTLFSLLFRLDPKIRRQYHWNELQRFVARYGILLRRVGVR